MILVDDEIAGAQVANERSAPRRRPPAAQAPRTVKQQVIGDHGQPQTRAMNPSRSDACANVRRSSAAVLEQFRSDAPVVAARSPSRAAQVTTVR